MEAQILSQSDNESCSNFLIIDDRFLFLEEAIQRTVDGKKGFCFVCGKRANKPGDFICPVCFKGANKEEAGRGVDIARAAISAFIKAGGVVEHMSKNFAYNKIVERIDDDLFREIVNAGKAWLSDKENSDATVDELYEHLAFVFNKINKGAVGNAAGTAFKFYGQHQTLWNNAVNVVDQWYKKNSNDFREPFEVGHAIMEQLRPEVGEKKLIAAICQYQSSDEFQKRKKNWLFQRCEGVAKDYLGKTFDNRHPGEIAQEIIDNCKKGDPLPQSILPMLTRAVANLQDELRQAERKRLTASYGGGRKIKKPGSAARRHNGHNSKAKVRMAGAKKRGVKG